MSGPDNVRHIKNGLKNATRSSKRQIREDLNGVSANFALSEDVLAEAFTSMYMDKLLYDHIGGYWYIWDDYIWRKERTKMAYDYARKVVKRVGKGMPKWNKTSIYMGIETICKCDRIFATTLETFDKNPWLLGTPAGTVDLQTGELRPSDPLDKITRSTLCGPAPPGEVPEYWMRFLHEITLDNVELIRFLQELCGYALTGLTVEHAMAFIYGEGGNGKGTFIDTIVSIMGTYAAITPMETLTASRYDRHPTEIAALKGARLVTASETEKGRFWAESKIKEITGGGKLTARFMRQDFFEFQPEFLLIVVGNHKPRIGTCDEAMKRRMNIINFDYKPVNVNPFLRDALIKEAPQILRWMIDGCLMWRENGLEKPLVVTEATDEYFEEQDIFSKWIEDECEIGARFWEPAGRLYESWFRYAKANEFDHGNQTSFGREMAKKGFYDKKKSGGIRIREGIRLIPKPVNDEIQYPDTW